MLRRQALQLLPEDELLLLLALQVEREPVCGKLHLLQLFLKVSIYLYILCLFGALLLDLLYLDLKLRDLCSQLVLPLLPLRVLSLPGLQSGPQLFSVGVGLHELIVGFLETCDNVKPVLVVLPDELVVLIKLLVGLLLEFSNSLHEFLILLLLFFNS